jgi:hypothetical protein
MWLLIPPRKPLCPAPTAGPYALRRADTVITAAVACYGTISCESERVHERILDALVSDPVVRVWIQQQLKKVKSDNVKIKM